MLATPWPAPFSDDDWVFEPKWDGVRALVTVDGDRVTIRGRRGTDYTNRYPELQSLRHRRPCVLDGEIVAIVAGAPSFERLQRRMHVSAPDRRLQREVPASFVAFDILHDGGPMIDLALEERRERLEAVEPGTWGLVGPVVPADGEALWATVTERDLEGMVAKRRGSRYRPGVRSPDWRKIANVLVTEAVVGGFTPGEGGRGSTFGGLVLGKWDGDRLRFVGSVGTGFSEAEVRSIRAALDEMTRDDPPFHHDDGLPGGATWVEPLLVASIGYRDTTAAGRLRHPRFRGFTDDDPGTVVLG
jgi:bifunctional non-homologous end joining protein LigD